MVILICTKCVLVLFMVILICTKYVLVLFMVRVSHLYGYIYCTKYNSKWGY